MNAAERPASRNWMLIPFLVMTLGIGGLGSIFTSQSVETWFPLLTKPSWNPPSWVFGPVWTTLYILMAVAAWRVWLRGKFWGTPAVLFAANLLLNLAWSLLFFGLRQPGTAFAEILVLLVSILAMTVSFGKIDRVAAWLLGPYLAWVSFASVLNYSIWILNRS